MINILTMISEASIGELKNMNHVDIIEQYVPLKRSGSEYVGLCPFHDENTPSFYVHPSKGYKCFGCDAKGANAIDFIMAIENKTFPEAVEHLAGMTGIMIGIDVPMKPRPKIKPIQAFKSKPVDYIPEEMISRYLATHNQNNLYRFFSSLMSRTKADELFQRYGVGTYNDGRVIFIQRNITGSINQVKLMRYDDPVTGKRGHGKWDSLVAGTTDNFMGEDANLMQCFFGEHLLSLLENEGKPIAIVESEKTALIASFYYPKFLWLATGGKQGCSITNPRINKVLHDRHIHLFPDVDGVTEWKEKAAELRRQGFGVFVNDVMAKYAEPGSREDIADLIVRSIQQAPPHPCWSVEMKGILRKYLAGEITGDQFLDLQDENCRQSQLSMVEYVRQINYFSVN